MPVLIAEVPWLQRLYWGATVADYAWCCSLALAALIFKRLFARLIAKLTSGLAARTTGGKYRGLFKSLIRKPVEWLFAIVLLFIAVSHIATPLRCVVLFRLQHRDGAVAVTAAGVIDHLFFFFAILFSAHTISRLADFIYRAQMEHAHHRQQMARRQILPLIKELVKGLIWVISFFWMLGVVFEVNIPALITGLGIGGVALALAAKESIENLFASLTILTDKPFGIGDTIRVGGLEGKVQRIGFRSARLRGMDGALYIIPNKKLVDENVENLTQRDTRGVKIVLNIQTGLEEDSLQKMITALKEMIQTTLHVIDPVKVSLDGFNEKTFLVILIYHLPPSLPDGKEDDIKQEISRRAYGIVMKYTTMVKVASGSEPSTSDNSDSGK